MWYLLLKHFKMFPIQLYYSTIVNYRQSSIQLSKASDKNNRLLKFRTLGRYTFYGEISILMLTIKY